mmetsp:Transcript_32018/g.46144  ORF Transcript_32018/g.46144 Transcript_32018/m.46144 type:complete len:443 (+) Transcript_32018:62-1390(+)
MTSPIQKFTTFNAATTLGIIQNGTILGINDRNNELHFLVRTVGGEGVPFALENIQEDFGESSHHFSCFNDFLYAASIKGCCEYTFNDIVSIREEQQSSPLNFKQMVTECHEKAIAIEYEIENIEIGLKKLFDVLGLHSAAEKFIASNKNEMLSLQTSSHWVIRQLESLPLFDCTVEGFCNAGFCESAAKDFHMYFTSSSMFELQPVGYWIVRYFKCMMMTPLKNSTPANTVTWNRVSTKEPFNLKEVAAIYTSSTELNAIENSYNLLLDEMKNKSKNAKSLFIYFHATCSESVDFILSDGINIGIGSKNQDFSHQNGFYLFEQNNFHLAVDWAKSWLPNAAILVFAVYDDEINGLECFNMERNVDETWKKYVSDHRQGICSRDSYAFIRGTACGNPIQVRNIRDPMDPEAYSNPFIQICLKSSKSVDIFYRALTGILYIVDE